MTSHDLSRPLPDARHVAAGARAVSRQRDTLGTVAPPASGHTCAVGARAVVSFFDEVNPDSTVAPYPYPLCSTTKLPEDCPLPKPLLRPGDLVLPAALLLAVAIALACVVAWRRFLRALLLAP